MADGEDELWRDEEEGENELEYGRQCRCTGSCQEAGYGLVVIEGHNFCCEVLILSCWSKIIVWPWFDEMTRSISIAEGEARFLGHIEAREL